MVFFPDRIIALNHPVECPPRSTDLTHCDCFLWGYLNSKVYTLAPTTIDDLFQLIEREVKALKGNPSLVLRVNLCIENNGRHIEG